MYEERDHRSRERRAPFSDRLLERVPVDAPCLTSTPHVVASPHRMGRTVAQGVFGRVMRHLVKQVRASIHESKYNNGDILDQCSEVADDKRWRTRRFLGVSEHSTFLRPIFEALKHSTENRE